MKKSFEHIPKEQRKKILLVCDDIRVHSGVATVAKEIVIHTAHHFNWVNVAGAIKHPEKGKTLDISQSVNTEAKIEDANVKLYCVDGYAQSIEIQQILSFEKPSENKKVVIGSFFFLSILKYNISLGSNSKSNQEPR